MRVYKVSRFVIAEDLYGDKKEAIFIKADVVQRREKCNHPTYIFVSESRWAVTLFSFIYSMMANYKYLKERLTPKSATIDYDQTEEIDIPNWNENKLDI